ncbi:hypothetical protein [Faecalicoccus pleomorphus]|uniref:hypothetical protein n=1 Tax=Faecalicoccus pleomorphus TaxID=1323 RepID=UPI00242A9D7F|nr:hypothetical protein [Faecalicoccus pleomorphus]
MKKKLISLLMIPILCLFAVCSFHFVKADTELGMVQVNLHTDGQLENSDVLKNMPITLTSTTDASQTFTLTCEDNSNVIKTKKTIPLGDYVVSFQLPKNYEALSGVYTNGPRTDTYVQNGNVVTLNEKYAYNMIYINIKEREEPQPVEKYGKVEVNLHTDGKLVESDVLKNMPVTLVPKEDSTKTYTLNCQDDSNRAELGNVPFGEYIVSFDIPEKYEVLDGKVGSGVMGNYLQNGDTIAVDSEYAYKQFYINVKEKKEAATDNGSQNHESNENASSSNDSKKQESKDPNADKKKSKSVKTAVFVNSLFFVSLSLFTGILTILFYKKTKKS